MDIELKNIYLLILFEMKLQSLAKYVQIDLQNQVK